MANLLETAVLAANAGAAVLREKWSQPRQIQRKQRFDFVTDADRASQDAVLSAISRLRPGDAILAEEDAEDYSHAAGTPGVLWVIDPLDGTTNFIHGFPMVAVSVAAVVDGIPEAGVVIDVVRNEVFSAERGKGAWLNGQDIAVHGIADRSQCLLLTGFPFRDRARLDRYMELFKELFRQVSGMRRAGAAALDLAYVAAGRAQAFWELGLKPWDMAAGILLIKEAGGITSDFGGGAHELWRGDIVAGAPEVHPWVQQVCGKYFPNG